MFPMYPTFGMMWPNILKLRNDYPEPPTIYSILNSYVNFSKETPEKIKNLAKTGRAVIFDFDYPLTSNIDKESFECMILNHFLMRRIGYETFTAFNIALNVKLNEIMPTYNIMYEKQKDILENIFGNVFICYTYYTNFFLNYNPYLSFSMF